MDGLQKFLHYSQTLEELQTSRKAKGVDEIRKFDVQRERQKGRDLECITEAERARKQKVFQQLDQPLQLERQHRRRRLAALHHLERFEAAAKDVRINAPGNEFEVLAELQGADFGEEPYEMKQLPSGGSDVFENEIGDLTELELQRELEYNSRAITEGQEPAVNDAVQNDSDEYEDMPENEQAAKGDEEEKELVPEQAVPKPLSAETRETSRNVLYFRPRLPCDND